MKDGPHSDFTELAQRRLLPPPRGVSEVPRVTSPGDRGEPPGKRNDVGALDTDALRARVRTRVKELRTAFADDVPAARETLRQLLEGPARAVPVMVNGAPKYLVRAKVSAAALLPPGVVSKLGGDPKGN